MSDSSCGTGCGCNTAVTPAAAAGEREVQRLRFVTCAEQLGIDGADLAAIVAAYDRGSCADTRQLMATAVAGRLASAQAEVVELTEHAAAVQTDPGAGLGTPPAVLDAQRRVVDVGDRVARLHAAAEHLAATPGGVGACDAGCACSTASTALHAVRVPVSRSALAGSSTGGTDLACTLAGGVDAMRARIDEWQAAIGRAVAREPVDGGIALSFAHDVELTVELARLAAAEYACCSFFAFTIGVDAGGVRFTVTAPGEAQDVVAAVFGVGAASVGGN